MSNDDSNTNNIICEDNKSSLKTIQTNSILGFLKGVNDYLNHYVTVSDAKAAAMIAINIVVIQFIVKEQMKHLHEFSLQYFALCFFSISLLLATFALFPRLPRGTNGLIFWEDIRKRKDEDQYYFDVSSIDGVRQEKEYAYQIFYISNVLHKKMRLMQWAISIFIIGMAFAIVSILN